MDELERVWTEHALQVAGSLDRITPDAIAADDQNFIVRGLKDVPRESRGRMRLLDVGCGIGQYIKTANLLGFDAEGIEISQTAAAIAKQHGLRVTPGDIRNLPFDDDSFDLIVAGGSLEHFRETETALREIHRVMKTEALLLGNVPYRYTLFVLAKFGQQAAGVWKCGYEKSFSVARWKRISEACGLKVHAVEISRYRAGRHRILGGMLELADRGTNLIGLGGHHIFFQASKLT